MLLLLLLFVGYLFNNVGLYFDVFDFWFFLRLLLNVICCQVEEVGKIYQEADECDWLRTLEAFDGNLKQLVLFHTLKFIHFFPRSFEEI